MFTVGPFTNSRTILGDRVRRRGRFLGGLGLSTDHNPSILYFSIGHTCECDDSAGVEWFMTAGAVMTVWETETAKMCCDLIAHIPRGEIINL